MRTLIAWTLTLAVGASASAQMAAPATKKTNPPAATKATPAAPAVPLDPKAEKAKLEVARAEMDRVLEEWEKKSKEIVSLDVLFDRIDESKAWGNQYYQGRAVLQSPDLACLQFQKYKVDADGKPLFVTKDGKKMPNLEPEPSERIVCTGREVLQYSWDDHKIFIFPLDKQSRQKALQEGPLPFLFNMRAADTKKRYTMSLLNQDDKDFMIQILPNEEVDKSSFSKAFLRLSKTTYLPSQLWLYPIGAKERQEFRFAGNSNTILANKTVDQNLFLAKKIDGWTVVENPGGDAPAAKGAAPALGQPVRRQVPQPASNPSSRPR